MNLTVHLYLHGSDEQLTRIERSIHSVLLEGKKMTQVVDDLVAEVANLKNAFAPLPAAVDALEAKVTEALKNSGISQADFDAITAAIADIKSVAAGVAGAVTDASDGVDEAA